MKGKKFFETKFILVFSITDKDITLQNFVKNMYEEY